MTPDQEREAETLAIWRIHGDQARFHIVKRIGALALEGDMAGIERWQQIAAKLDDMQRASRQ